MEVKDKKVKILDDGRVEITLLMPLPLFRYKKWVKSYAHESELIIEGDKITGMHAFPMWLRPSSSLSSRLGRARLPNSVKGFLPSLPRIS